MKALSIASWCILVYTAGCAVGNPIPTGEYSPFMSRSGGHYAPDRNGGEVSVWYSPERYGYEIQGLSIRNLQAPLGSAAEVSGPSSAKGEQWIILRARNVNSAKGDLRITWDVYQEAICKQSMTVVISPPPTVKVEVMGAPGADLRPPR
jgi:hypothetical protein